jgi:ABC-type nitrate/sulfonate/bicarbonate transport system permease component
LVITDAEPATPHAGAATRAAAFGAVQRVLNVAVSLGAVVLIWELISLLKLVNPALFPSPADTWSAAVDLARSGVLFSDLAVSLTRAAVGFGIGAILGVVVGLLTARVRAIQFVLGPFLTVLRPIPAVALVPIAIVWFGIGEPSKYFVIAYTVFLAVWLNTHHGMERVPRTFVLASRTLGASRVREFIEVIVPAAAPHIVAGLRLGAGLAFLSLVAAELSGASSGIGFRLQEARQYIRTDIMFVGLIELGILGALLDTILVAISHRVVHWEDHS